MTGRRPALALLLLAAGLGGCKREDMYAQNELRSWDHSHLLPHETTMQPPVPGTVARNIPDPPVAQPNAITVALLQRGQQRYDIFCTPCHAASGDGHGRIVDRGFPMPPPLFAPRLRSAKARHFYDVITNGHGVMYSYADRVPSADRWAIVAYIRALQLGQGAQVASLPADDRSALAALR